MANLNFTIDQDDGLNVWIKQTLQDELTGAEFSKLENVLNKNHFQDLFSGDLSSLSNLNNKIKEFLIPTNLTALPAENDTNLEEIKKLEQKAREILIDEAWRLDFDSFKNLLQCTHINKNSNNIANVKLQNETDETKSGIFLYKETDNQAESKEESSEEVEYKIGGNLFEALRQNLIGRDFREFSECVENGTPSDDLFDKAKEILIKCLESYPILIAISKGNFGGVSIGDILKNVSK
ncbi:hypothetical protein [Helicobacter sp. T3_23-1056]